MRLKLISCEIFYREMCASVARSPNQVDVEFLSKGLHDIGTEGMFGRLQKVLTGVDDASYDAVLLGYGICNNGIVGLKAGAVPLVVPRAHDCITLLLGSKERYREYFDANPGVYFKSTGWIERTERGELPQLSIQQQSGMDMSYDDLVEKYGEDNAKFLFEQIGDRTRNYGQLTFIEMGVEPDRSFEQKTRDDAEEKGWAFDKLQGDLTMIQRLVDGQWDDKEFLVVPPGRSVVASFDEGVIGLDGEAK